MTSSGEASALDIGWRTSWRSGMHRARKRLVGALIVGVWWFGVLNTGWLSGQHGCV